MKRYFLLMPCMLGLLGCQADASPSAASQSIAADSPDVMDAYAIGQNVKAAIDAEDFAGLTAMEETFLQTRGRTPSGLWQLGSYYEALNRYLGEGLESDQGCQYRHAKFVQRWMKADPLNPAPAITGAALLLEQAWCIRGTGYADTVAADAWPTFKRGADAAAVLLEQNRKSASIDPEYYAVKLDVLRAQGASKAAFRQVIDEATAREPGYHRTYFNAVWYYLPQWGGSYAEVDAFARYAAQRSRSAEGSGLYARIFLSLEECDCHVLRQAADWPTFKAAMHDIYDRYPGVSNAQRFALISCEMGDTEEGHHFYRLLHPEVTNDSSFVAIFAGCDHQAKMFNDQS